MSQTRRPRAAGAAVEQDELGDLAGVRGEPGAGEVGLLADGVGQGPGVVGEGGRVDVADEVGGGDRARRERFQGPEPLDGDREPGAQGGVSVEEGVDGGAEGVDAESYRGAQDDELAVLAGAFVEGGEVLAQLVGDRDEFDLAGAVLAGPAGRAGPSAWRRQRRGGCRACGSAAG